MTDGDYLAIFHQLIMPLAMEFNPSAVIVSAGYDCALGCPEVQYMIQLALNRALLGICFILLICLIAIGRLLLCCIAIGRFKL